MEDSALTYASIAGMVLETDPRVRKDAYFRCNHDTLCHIRAIRDQAGSLIHYSEDGYPKTIMGFPIEIDESATELTFETGGNNGR